MQEENPHDGPTAETRIRTIQGFGRSFTAPAQWLRVHYARVESHPVAVMVTYREGDLLYFGISKCNVKAGDTFNRERGKAIALHRMLHAMKVQPILGFSITKMYGTVRIHDAKSTVAWFKYQWGFANG